MSVDQTVLEEEFHPYEIVMKGPMIGQPGTAAIVVLHPKSGKVALAETYVAMMDGAVIGTLVEAVTQRLMPLIAAMLIEAGVLKAPEPNLGVEPQATDEKASEDVLTPV